MANLAGVLKDEIRRLARKEVRAELKQVRQTLSKQRTLLAALRREVAEQAREIRRLERPAGKAAAPAPEAGNPRRFSPKGLRSHRARLGLSASDYAALVGVSGLTIYNWEKEKSRPQAAQLEKLATVRGLGKREALRRLEEME